MIPQLNIIPIYFFTSFFISFFFIYLLSPLPKIIVKHPDPQKLYSDMYIDENNVCYKYKRVEVKCN